MTYRLVVDPIALRRARLACGMSQRGLAAAAGVRAATVADAEGGRMANVSTIRKLADALTVKPTDIARLIDV